MWTAKRKEVEDSVIMQRSFCIHINIRKNRGNPSLYKLEISKQKLCWRPQLAQDKILLSISFKSGKQRYKKKYYTVRTAQMLGQVLNII